MTSAQLEHVNITVSQPDLTAARLGRMFGWRIRWQGDSQMGGRTVHVGNDLDYLSVYAPVDAGPDRRAKASEEDRLGHIGVLVADLDATEARVRMEGFEPYGQASYEPGRRFYFRDDDGIEFEVVSYT